MAQPSPSPTDRIRTLTDDNAIFQAFDAYPWTKDKAFISGLDAILGNPSQPSNSSPSDLATHARIFYYAQRIGVTIDFTRYHVWLSEHPEHSPPQVLPESETPGAVGWQQAAPKMDLFVDKAAARDSGEEEPNYPMGFAEMLRLLQEGKEIPGIRQIPNTIARDPNIKPVGSLAAPRKPWEKDTPVAARDGALTQSLDADFPPIDGEDTASEETR